MLPFGVLAASALFALSIVFFEPSFIDRPFTQVARQTASKPAQTSDPAAGCSGALSSDYSCYQQHYQALVRDSGTEAAFKDLKDEYGKNNFVKANCHQLTHVIGRAALDLYGDVRNTYGHGDEFCAAGYYHGAIEAEVAKIGSDKLLDEAPTLCSDFGQGEQRHSYYHRNCAHGLGHGFMAAENSDLYKSLQACDALTDEWESDHCYNGVFMQNVMGQNDPNHPSKYLKADQPFYPCTDVETRYKDQCYKKQTSYVFDTQGGGFAKVFELCGGVEEDFRPSCYQGVGWDVSAVSIGGEGFTGTDSPDLTSSTCMIGKDFEARSNCATGAVKQFIQYYHGDEQAKEFCEKFNPKLQAACFEAGAKYSETFEA